MPENPNPETYTGNTLLEQLTDAVNYNAHLVALVRRHAPEPLRMVMDFGAGQGLFSGIFSGKATKVVAAETDSVNIAMLQGKGLAVTTLDATPDASLDYIYTINVLEHIEADEAIMRAFKRVLRPGGRVFVWVPAMPFLWSDLDNAVFHVRRYQRGELRRKLSAAGLQVRQERFADCVGIAATLAFKLLGGKVATMNPRAIRFYDRIAFPVSRTLDRLGAQWVLGKNLWAVAERPLS